MWIKLKNQITLSKLNPCRNTPQQGPHILHRTDFDGTGFEGPYEGSRNGASLNETPFLGPSNKIRFNLRKSVTPEGRVKAITAMNPQSFNCIMRFKAININIKTVYSHTCNLFCFVCWQNGVFEETFRRWRSVGITSKLCTCGYALF